MTSAPIAPSSGDKISASWMRALVNYVRAIKPIAGPGIRTLETPNGTILSCPVKPRRRGTSVLPWTFSCAIGEDEVGGEEERTGGWSNCRLQIGMDIDWHSPDLSASPSDTYHVIDGCDLCDDGDYYLEVTLANGTQDRQTDAAEIKVAGEGDQVPSSDYVNGILRLSLGSVVDGKISGYTPHLNPVVYKFL